MKKINDLGNQNVHLVILLNPDYFIISLFKYIIGGDVASYNVVASVPTNITGVRLFAFSSNPNISNGKLAVLAMNLQNSPTSVPITVNLMGPSPILNDSRTEYHLTGNVTIAHGTVSCNGTPLILDPVTDMPPPWSTLGVSASGPMILQPSSIVFATIF